MKKRQAYVRIEFGRVFCKKEFYFSVPGIAIILFLSANDGMGNMGDSALAAVLLSSYDAGFLIAFSLAAIPYATAFTDELEYNYARVRTRINLLFVAVACVGGVEPEKLCFFQNACDLYIFCAGNGVRYRLLWHMLCSRFAVGG